VRQCSQRATLSGEIHLLDWMMVASLTSAIAAYLAIKVIETTTARQQTRAARMNSGFGYR
jgi:hypothetical protein